MRLWLVGWTVGGITMLRAWLMQLRGEEVIHIASGTLRIRRGIGKRGRVFTYAVRDISDLRVIVRPWHERLFRTSFDLVRGYGASGRASLQHGAKAFVAMAVLRSAAQATRAEDVAGGANRVGQGRAYTLIRL